MRLTSIGLVLVIPLVFASFGRIFVRVQTTSIGYELGRLKTKEGELMEERAQLKMELARSTTKKNLLNLLKQPTDAGDVASR